MKGSPSFSLSLFPMTSKMASTPSQRCTHTTQPKRNNASLSTSDGELQQRSYNDSRSSRSKALLNYLSRSSRTSLVSTSSQPNLTLHCCKTTRGSVSTNRSNTLGCTRRSYATSLDSTLLVIVISHLRTTKKRCVERCSTFLFHFFYVCSLSAFDLFPIIMRCPKRYVADQR